MTSPKPSDTRYVLRMKGIGGSWISETEFMKFNFPKFGNQMCSDSIGMRYPYTLKEAP